MKDFLKNVLGRVSDIKTTGAGVLSGAVVIYIFNSLGCQTPDNWMVWMASVIAALPGILAKN